MIGSADGEHDRPVRRRRQVDVLIGVGFLCGEDLLGRSATLHQLVRCSWSILVLAVEELVERVHGRDHVEVVLLRRAGGDPLEACGHPTGRAAPSARDFLRGVPDVDDEQRARRGR